MIDQPSLNRVAERAAAVITGLAEYQRQRRTALRLREAMLPRVNAAPDGFEIASRYLPGDVGVYVGGDWFDVIETRNRHRPRRGRCERSRHRRRHHHGAAPDPHCR